MKPNGNRRQELESWLQAFHLSAFLEHYELLARQSEKQRLDHVGYLFQLAQLENELRQQRKTERLLQQAHLPRGKLLSDFDLSRIPSLSPSQVQSLCEGEWIDRRENLLIFGNPGTGKTHLCLGWAREWCLRGRRVRYTTAAALVQELLLAKRDLRLNALFKRLSRYEVLIIDDISYIPQDREETDVLFLLLSERYEQGSLAITSNLVFSEWTRIFKDEMTTTAAIDRLVHYATILELHAESYRVSEAQRRRNNVPATAPDNGQDLSDIRPGCPNPDCQDLGKVGQGNIQYHSHKVKRFRCTTCQRTFSAHKGITGAEPISP